MVNEGFYLEVEVDSLANKQYFYTTNDKISVGDYVVVDTSFSQEVARVVGCGKKESEHKGGFAGQIVRVASEEDLQEYEENKHLGVKARDIFNECVKKLELNMKLIHVVYSLDKSKILYTYVSEERVDFRELLKELSNVLKCRIELKQIGPRDRSKSVGGIGICGLPLCCKSFLNEFEGISINMAKNQFLALNIQKISGQCGKLLCCLKYEDDQYTELKKSAPKYGSKFKFEDKDYKITGVNLLSKTIKIESFDKEVIKVITFKEYEEMDRK